VGGGAPFDPHVPASEHGMGRCSRESPFPSLRARGWRQGRGWRGAALRKWGR
jgi:hypothetical protein